MIGGNKMQLGSLEFENFLPKIVGESWITIEDSGIGSGWSVPGALTASPLLC
jgi:hypothetical protein